MTTKAEQTIAGMSTESLKTCIEALAKTVAQNPSDVEARHILVVMARALHERQGCPAVTAAYY